MAIDPVASEYFCTVLRSGLAETARSMLQRNDIDPSHRSSMGQTPLHIAASVGLTAIGTELLARGCHVDSRDERGRTPLMNAAASGHTETAELLIHAGADIDATTDKMRWTAMMWAARHRQLSMIKLLMKHGASWEICDLRGRTAADIANTFKAKDCARMLATPLIAPHELQ